MNTQRFIISVIAVFAFMFAYEYVVHGQLLMPLYNETPSLWRPMDAMMNFMPWMIVTSLALAAVITYLFTRHYEAKGYGEGARFGLYIGLILGLMQFGAYYYLPISLNMALAWFVAYVIEGVGVGLVLSAVYRR